MLKQEKTLKQDTGETEELPPVCAELGAARAGVATGIPHKREASSLAAISCCSSLVCSQFS